MTDPADAGADLQPVFVRAHARGWWSVCVDADVLLVTQSADEAFARGVDAITATPGPQRPLLLLSGPDQRPPAGLLEQRLSHPEAGAIGARASLAVGS